MPTRRSVLIGGGLVAVGGSTAYAAARERLAAGSGRAPDVGPARVEFGRFVSAARRGANTRFVVITPAVPVTRGATEPHDLPLVVALHHHGGTHYSLVAGLLRLERFLQAHVDAGGAPFVIAAADGANDYWHPRPDGIDPAAMVVDEFLPRLAARGLRAEVEDRIGLIGWSMGGYGALHLAGSLGPTRVGATVAVSPALWTNSADAAPAGFGDSSEYEEYSVFGRQRELDGIAVRIDCGTGDGFLEATTAYASGLADDAEVEFRPGRHDERYWHRVLPDQLAFLGRHLSQQSAGVTSSP